VELNILLNNMPTVTLQDGRKINFATTPTQADIDEVVSKFTPIKPIQPEATGSLSPFRPKQIIARAGEAIKEEFGGAAKQIQEAIARKERGEQGVLRTGITTLAQGTQAGLSTAFRGIFGAASIALPDFIENPLRRKLGDKFDDFIESETGQKLVSEIQNVSEKIDTLDPKNRQLIRDVGDIAMTGVDLATFGVGGKATRRGLEKVGKEAGEKGAEILQRSERDQIENVRGKLADMIIDDTTPTKRSAVSTRTIEGGFFSGRTIKPTATENKIVDELLTTPDIKANRSSLFNLNSITRTIKEEAQDLRQALKENNFIAPKREAISRLSLKLEDLKATDTDIIGDSERLADRIFEKMRVFIEDSDGTGLGFLNARQNFDTWVRIKKPKAFEKQDAFNTAVRSARNTVNDFLVEKATKTEVKKSLTRQSMLKRAEDVLKVKAGKEAPTGFGRLLDKAMAILGRKNQIVQLMATLVGIGGLGAAATFAPAVAVGGGLVGAAIGLVRLLKSPAGRKKLGQLLLLIEKALPTAKGEKKEILTELRDEVKALLDKDVSVGLSIEDVSKKGKGAIPSTKGVSSLAQEARKFNTAEEFVEAQYKGDISPLDQHNTDRAIKLLNESGVPVKSGEDILTLYHGTNTKGLKGITESGTLNPFSYLATDKNAAKGFVYGRGDVVEVKVPVSDAGYVQTPMAGKSGATIQNPLKLIKGNDGIYRAEKLQTKSQLTDIFNKAKGIKKK